MESEGDKAHVAKDELLGTALRATLRRLDQSSLLQQRKRLLVVALREIAVACAAHTHLPGVVLQLSRTDLPALKLLSDDHYDREESDD